jgi:hypothetical protein
VSFAVAFVLAAAFAVTAYADPLVLAAVVLAAQVLVVADWHRAVGAPGAAGGAGLALAVGVGAVGLLVVRDDASPLAALTGLLGAATVAVLVHQVLRRERTHVTASMSASGALVVVTLCAALYLPAAAAADGSSVVAVVVVSTVAAHAVARLAPPRVAADGLALGAGAVAGAALGAVTGVGPLIGAAAGLAAAVVSHVAARWLHAADHPRPWLHASLPLCLAAPAAYATAKLVGG